MCVSSPCRGRVSHRAAFLWCRRLAPAPQFGWIVPTRRVQRGRGRRSGHCPSSFYPESHDAPTPSHPVPRPPPTHWCPSHDPSSQSGCPGTPFGIPIGQGKEIFSFRINYLIKHNYSTLILHTDTGGALTHPHTHRQTDSEVTVMTRRLTCSGSRG